MSKVQLKDTLDYVDIDWAAENAFLKDGEYYERDPGQAASSSRVANSASTPKSDFERGQAIAKSLSEVGATRNPDFERGREIARSIRR